MTTWGFVLVYQITLQEMLKPAQGFPRQIHTRQIKNIENVEIAHFSTEGVSFPY